MIVLDRAPLPLGAFLAVVLAAMLATATLIAGAFMHLRLRTDRLSGDGLRVSRTTTTNINAITR